MATTKKNKTALLGGAGGDYNEARQTAIHRDSYCQRNHFSSAATKAITAIIKLKNAIQFCDHHSLRLSACIAFAFFMFSGDFGSYLRAYFSYTGDDSIDSISERPDGLISIPSSGFGGINGGFDFILSPHFFLDYMVALSRSQQNFCKSEKPAAQDSA